MKRFKQNIQKFKRRFLLILWCQNHRSVRRETIELTDPPNWYVLFCQLKTKTLKICLV